MKQRVILDTGPLVALLRKQDQFHRWAKGNIAQVEPPLLTCEPIITEACFLLRHTYPGQEAVLALIDRGVVQISLALGEEYARIRELVNKYRSVPMSLADACLVRMAEMNPASELLTLDSDFTIYRKNGNQSIPVLMPEF